MQPQRPHNRHSCERALAQCAIDIRKHPIAQLKVLAANRFYLGIVQLACIRDGRALVATDLHWPRISRVPSPWQAQFPIAAVTAEQRAESSELKPAKIKFRGKFFCRHKPADVGPPIRNPTQAGVDANWDLGLQRLPRREDITRPQE